MEFQERSYNAKWIRPRPRIYLDPSGDFVLILTLWGDLEQADVIFDQVKQHLQSVREDRELTTPFQNILTLSDEANNLRVATLITNDLIYRNLNNEKYSVVAETCYISIKKQNVAWCQMGGPHLFMRKKNDRPQPISCFPESKKTLESFPLPNYFMGAEPTISPRCGDLYLESGDEIILLSSSTVPAEIWNLNESATVEAWTDALVKSHEGQPFWLGRLKLD